MNKPNRYDGSPHNARWAVAWHIDFVGRHKGLSHDAAIELFFKKLERDKVYPYLREAAQDLDLYGMRSALPKHLTYEIIKTWIKDSK